MDISNSHSVKLPDTVDSRLVDLLNRLLEKDPTRRIKMSELRVCPWAEFTEPVSDMAIHRTTHG